MKQRYVVHRYLIDRAVLFLSIIYFIASLITSAFLRPEVSAETERFGYLKIANWAKYGYFKYDDIEEIFVDNITNAEVMSIYPEFKEHPKVAMASWTSLGEGDCYAMGHYPGGLDTAPYGGCLVNGKYRMITWAFVSQFSGSDWTPSVRYPTMVDGVVSEDGKTMETKPMIRNNGPTNILLPTVGPASRILCDGKGPLTPEIVGNACAKSIQRTTAISGGALLRSNFDYAYILESKSRKYYVEPSEQASSFYNMIVKSTVRNTLDAKLTLKSAKENYGLLGRTALESTLYQTESVRAVTAFQVLILAVLANLVSGVRDLVDNTTSNSGIVHQC